MCENVVQARARCTECHREYPGQAMGRPQACEDCGGPLRSVETHLREARVCPECQAISPHGGEVCGECGAHLAGAAPRAAGETGDRQHRPSHPHLSEALVCPKCKAINPHGEAKCVECGLALGPRHESEEAEEAAQQRRDVARSLRRGYRRMTTVTWLYRAGALGYAGVTLAAIGALGQPDVPLAGGLLVVALTTTLTVLMLMGAMQIAFRPFMWTVLLASLATLVSIVHLFGPNPFGLMFLGTGAWALVLWAMLPSALEFRRLIAQYTDEYVLHHASLRTRRTLSHHSVEDRHERLISVMRRAGARAWLVSAAVGVLVVAVSALATFGVVNGLRPEELTESIEQFESAWNRGDRKAVEAFFPANVRRLRSQWLTGVGQGHGWGAGLPDLGASRVRPTQDHTWVHYELGELELSAGWALSGREWFISRIELPPPPFEPVMEQFLEAWKRSDLEALASFVPASYRERMHESLTLSAGYRDWEVLPEVQSTETAPAPGGETFVIMHLSEGVVTTRWLFQNTGSWGLQAFTFPEL